MAKNHKNKYKKKQVDTPKTNWKTYVVIASLSFLTLTGLSLAGHAAGLFYYFSQALPEPTPSAMASLPQSSRIYDRHGGLLYELHGDIKRRAVPLADIPLALQQATIAIEDKNFYEHHGFDVLGIARAFYKNLENRQIKQGASTITQQLARTVFLDQDRVYSRKIKELILAIRIEKLYSKDEILEMYLNNIPYGSNAYGVSAASEIYYDKKVNELDLLESAYLAALPKAPSTYSPFGPNQDALTERARSVLAAMLERGYISESERDAALALDKPNFVSAPTQILAPHFVFYVIDELKKTLGEKEIREGGLEILTSLDFDLQLQAEVTVTKWGEINEEKYQATNAALVALDPATGQVLAMVGSRNYFRPGDGAFNVATSLRQPGSSFKPYVYAAALNDGLTPNSVLIDTRTNFAANNFGVKYVPRNYSGTHYGPVTMRKALAGSLNVPAVKAIVEVGIDNVIDLAEKMGIGSLSDRDRFGPSLALGGGEVRLLEHTAGLGVFANEGKKQPLAPILRINEPGGKLVYEWQGSAGEQVVHPHTAYWINNILSDDRARQYIFGSKNKLQILDRQVAAKTGTSQDFHDAWTLGYTPDLGVGVWVGNNNNEPIKEGGNGYVVATPIWHEFMEKALAARPKTEFERPADLVEPPPVRMPVQIAAETATSSALLAVVPEDKEKKVVTTERAVLETEKTEALESGETPVNKTVTTLAKPPEAEIQRSIPAPADSDEKKPKPEPDDDKEFEKKPKQPSAS